MTSLVFPSTTQSPKRAYTPLPDGLPIAPTVVMRNGTVIYQKRASSFTGSSTSGESERDAGRRPRFESEETLESGVIGKVEAHTRDNVYEGEGDIGEMRKGTGTVKGKGKERMWDTEEGFGHDGGRYPPVNDTESEERRIQENLSKFAARDMARRRAARLSRQLPASPSQPSSPQSSSSTTSFMRRPFSMLSTITGSGTSNGVVGLMDGIIGGTGTQIHQLPLARSSSSSSSSQPGPYSNPYDPQPVFQPAPKMVASADLPQDPSPFADPRPHPQPDRRISMASSVDSGVSPQSPGDGQGFTYGYAGPTWRGGGGVQQQVQPRGDKWWHALCAWGSDLDGDVDEDGQGGQAGRTNPFE